MNGEHTKPVEVRSEEQKTDPEKLDARMGKLIDLPNGSRVAGYILDGGGFQWIFTSGTGVKTRLHLSEDATYAIGLIAEALLNPGKAEDA